MKSQRSLITTFHLAKCIAVLIPLNQTYPSVLVPVSKNTSYFQHHTSKQACGRAALGPGRARLISPPRPRGRHEAVVAPLLTTRRLRPCFFRTIPSLHRSSCLMLPGSGLGGAREADCGEFHLICHVSLARFRFRLRYGSVISRLFFSPP